MKKEITTSEVPTIKFSEVCSLIQSMEDALDIIANDDQYEGFDAALEMVKEFFLGGYEFDQETGEIVTTLKGKETSRVPKILFENGSSIETVETESATRPTNVVHFLKGKK